MPHKKVHRLCRLMEFQCRFGVSFNPQWVFARGGLLDICPSATQRFFGLMACNDLNCNIHPPANHRPKCCHLSSLEAVKKVMSCRATPWCNNQGNPARSGSVSGTTKEVKTFEVCSEGCPSHAKRTVRTNEFWKSLRLLPGQPCFDCKHKRPMVAAARFDWQAGRRCSL